MASRSAVKATWLILPLLLLGAVALRLLAGPDGLGFPAGSEIWRLRLLRVGSAATVGAALAASGAMLQALLRNPLAAPSVLGLTTGAGLGVSIAVYVSALSTGAIALAQTPFVAASVGALGALALVYALAQRRGELEPITLILVGVIVSAIASAATMFIQHLMPDAGLALASRWLLGAISDDIRPMALFFVAMLTMVGVALGALLGPHMDAATLSDDEAQSLGVPLGALRVTLFLTAGLLAAGATAIAGPIAFVGLVCPHIVRLGAGPAHRPLVPLSAVAGATVILLADTLVRLIDFGAGRMPIGVLTALVGGPVFLVLLKRNWTVLQGVDA